MPTKWILKHTNNNYSEVSTPKQVAGVLNEAARYLTPVHVWTKDEQLAFESILKEPKKLLDDLDSGLTLVVPQGLDRGAIRDLKAGSERFCFSIALGRAVVLFEATLLYFGASSINFEFPKKLYKLQRRKDLRVPFFESHGFQAEFDLVTKSVVHLKRPILDLSAGGLSLLMEQEDVKDCGKDDLLKNLSFKIEGVSVRSSAVVSQLFALKQKGKATGIKLGAVFQNLSKADEHRIAKFVFEENRKHFWKFL